MLWSWPTLAHRPIVPGVNLTFDDASNSAASERDIQSEGGFDIGQSGSFADAGVPAESLAAGSEPDDDPATAAGDSAPSLDPVAPSLRSVRPGLLVLDRSLRAQPLPL